MIVEHDKSAFAGPEQLSDEVPAVTRRSVPRIKRRQALGLHPAMIVVLGMCAFLVRMAIRSGLSGDVFYELEAGRWMLAHHAIARSDVFSYTIKGRSWTDEEWGFQVLLAWMVAHIGAISYWLVSAGACCMALLLSVARWRRTGTGWLWSAALSVLAGAGMYLWVTPRPQDISYMLFAALMWVLTVARRRSVWLVAVPPLLLVWANLHGSFLLGLGILVLEMLWALLPRFGGRLSASKNLPAKPVALCLAGSVVATMVNPNGPSLLTYAYHVSSSPQLTQLIQEWQSPNFHSTFFLAVIVGPVLLLFGLLTCSDASFALDDVVIAGVLFVATLHAARFMPYLALAMCAVLSSWSPIKKETIKPTILTIPVAVLACAVLLVGPHVSAGDVQRGNSSMDDPVAATNFLEHQSGRVFTTYWWSDYMIYRGVPVFVDGRTDLYFGTGILDSYVNVASVNVDPDAVFRRWDIRWVMWNRGTPLSTYLASDPAWRQVYQAGDAVVFEHVGSW